MCIFVSNMNRTLSNISNFFLFIVDSFQDYAKNYLKNDFGACKPVYEMYKASTITLCDNVIDPINGLWTSMGMSLFFLLPALVLFKCISEYINKTMYMSVENEDEADLIGGWRDARRSAQGKNTFLSHIFEIIM